VTNVAFRKPAFMSGFEEFEPSKPEYGNDGDISMFETDYADPRWWMVDLADTYKIHFVVLVSRLYTMSDRHKGNYTPPQNVGGGGYNGFALSRPSVGQSVSRSVCRSVRPSVCPSVPISVSAL
jgi:hypothetical protein